MRTIERETAYVAFVTARQTHLRRIAYAVCGDWHQADDLLQTALVRLYVAWPRIRQQGSEEAYVRRILMRAHVDEHRRPWRRELPSSHRTDLDRAVHDDVEDRTALFDALQELPLMQRDGRTFDEWANDGPDIRPVVVPPGDSVDGR
jgi:DNA-directed RNA polymerase specialized sigma24 family protein